MLNFEIEEFVKENKNGKEAWTKDAINLGKRFIQHLIATDNQLSGKVTKTVQPEWVDNLEFEIEKVQTLIKKIDNSQEQIKKFTEQSNQFKNELIEENSLKDLLFESGKPLEITVIKGLEILCYKAENYDDGELELDKIITSPENDRFIGECEGKDNKAIDISKLRQLSDEINEDFEKNDYPEEAFGLLFGNSQRLFVPADRSEFFTAKCLSAAKRRNIGLILTTDLFKVCKYLSENKNIPFKKKCRKAIKNGIGGVITFP
ncbi:MAG: hypothetical protein L3J11_00800 [Draconibacterium sp.]|nr:hypothetical protein [Draconibacterium sp.]